MSEVATQPKKGKYDRWKYYTLSAAAYSCLEDIQENQSRFAHFLHLAMEGFRELNFDFTIDVRAVILPMTAAKQVEWPCDMVDWIKVGFQCGNSIKVLTKDNNTAKTFNKDANCFPEENTACPDMAVATGDALVPFYGFYDNYGVSMDKLFGVALQYNYLGYFSEDEYSRVFNFKDLVQGFSEVYLEYITDGIDPTGYTVIPPYAFMVVKNYVHWKRKLYDSKFGDGERREAERIYNNSKDDYIDRILDLTIDDIKEGLRAGYRMTPKN